MNLTEFCLNVKYAFRPNKPKLLFRLALAVIRGSLLKKPILRYVDFAVDFRCNLKCEHCFATVLRKNDRKVMRNEDYKRVAEESMRLGAVNFSFQGGEPLLFNKLPDIISSCYPMANVISVTTNGTLLNEDNIAKLKKLGVDILTISLDSSLPEEHDMFRGQKGAYEKTIAGIKLALRKGLNVTLGTVVTHKSLRSEGITGLIKLAREMKVILNIILPVSAGRWAYNKEIALDEEDMKYITGLTRQSPYIRTDFQANLGAYGCGAAKEILYLTPYGDVLVCPFIHIKFGNIFNDTIKSIRNKALSNPYFSKYSQKCLASTDKEFVERYLSQTFDQKDLPVPSETVFK